MKRTTYKRRIKKAAPTKEMFLPEMFRFYKLSTGEEIIGVQDPDVKASRGMHSIQFPTKVTTMYDGEGGARLCLVRWCPFSQSRAFQVPAGHVIVMGPLNEDMSTYYKEALVKEIKESLKTPDEKRKEEELAADLDEIQKKLLEGGFRNGGSSLVQ
jgi:hypothetical protein